MTYDLNITFDDNLVTGNETIDTQHKELIDRIQNFVTACQNGDSKVKAIKLLDYLNEYTDFHLKKKKHFRKKPVIQSVKNIMKNMKSLKRQFRNCMNTFRSMKDQQIGSVNLYRKNVIDWLFGHIKTYDRSVAKFIFMKQKSRPMLK